MKNDKNYTMPFRRFASRTSSRRFLAAAAVFIALAFTVPQIWMHEDAFASTPRAEASRPQIPVQIPVKKPDAKQNKQQQPNGGVTRVRVNLVRLYVTVRDKHGAIVQNLNKKDFRVFEDGKEQTISFFSKDMTDPITLAMMIDSSGSQVDLLDAEKHTASRFLRDILHKDDLAMVVSFDTQVNLLADFTDDQQILHSAIEKAEINAPPDLGPTNLNQQGTVLYDAIYQVCRDRLPSETGRKALIILTDAEDEGSNETLQNAIVAAQEANAVIHVLLIAERGFYFQAGMGYGGGSVAREMAAQTGGRVISIRNDKDLDKAFDQISQELRSQYILAYYPTDTTANGGFRKVKVETTTAGLRVLTRKGYYAPGRSER
ncbi:MAG: VWA domain-containing protein [Candidatus Acidiferrales bacterium]